MGCCARYGTTCSKPPAGNDSLNQVRRVRQVIGTDTGADDYVCKPFGMMELVARVRALLRRAGSDAKNKVLENKNLEVFPDKHMVIADGREVSLTLKEFELLCLLLRNPGLVFTRDQILNHVWGYSFDGESRTVDVHVLTLRKSSAPQAG